MLYIIYNKINIIIVHNLYNVYCLYMYAMIIICKYIDVKFLYYITEQLITFLKITLCAYNNPLCNVCIYPSQNSMLLDQK